MQACDSTCAYCARVFFVWLKTRMRQMDLPEKGQVGPTFAAAAATSNRPEGQKGV